VPPRAGGGSQTRREQWDLRRGVPPRAGGGSQTHREQWFEKPRASGGLPKAWAWQTRREQ